MDITLHRSELAMAALSSLAPANRARTDLRREPRAPHAPAVTIRELQARDAASLSALLTTDAVTQFIHRPPSNVEGFARFIEWTQEEQAAGRQITFAIVAPGEDTAAGIIQVRACDPDFTRAEWGFVLAERYWGTGLFMASAQIVLRFLFDFVGLQRLEARSVVLNGRGNGVLYKLGATREGRLRRAFNKNGKYFDEMLWSLTASDWRQGRRHTPPQSH
jgi:ribosomal-protein-alanine N-acetyltransferase